MKTYNRNPLSFSTPSSSSLSENYFVHSNWKGISDNKNVLTVDEETFAVSNNVYVDEEGLLKSRPSLKYKKLLIEGRELVNILSFWKFSDVIVYLVLDEDYELIFQLGDKVSKEATVENVELVQIGNKIFIFEPDSLKYYDLADNRIYDGSDAIYVPVTKLVTDSVSKDYESPSALTTSYIVRYIYNNYSTLNYSNLYGKNLKVTIDGTEYDIVFKPRQELVLMSNILNLNVGNFTEDGNLMLSVSRLGNGILNSRTSLGMSPYYTSDFLTYDALPYVEGVLNYCTISEDGSYAVCIKTDGLYVHSVLSSPDSDYYPYWHNVLEGQEVVLNSNCSYYFKDVNNFVITVTNSEGLYILYCIDGVISKKDLVSNNNRVGTINKWNINNVIGDITESRNSTSDSKPYYTDTLKLTNINVIKYEDDDAILPFYDVIYDLKRTHTTSINNLSTPYKTSVYEKRYSVRLDYLNNYSSDTGVVRLSIENDTISIHPLCLLDYDYKISTWIDRKTCTRMLSNSENYNICINTIDWSICVNKDGTVNFGFNNDNVILSDTFVKEDSIVIPSLVNYRIHMHTVRKLSNGGYNFADVDIGSTSAKPEKFIFEPDKGYLMTSKGIYLYEDYTEVKTYDYLAYLFPVNPVSIYDDNLEPKVFATNDTKLYSTLGKQNVITFDEFKEGENKYFVPSSHCKLQDYYFSHGSTLYISSNTGDEYDKLYLPIKRNQKFDSDILNLHPISSNEVAVFLNDSIYYTVYENDVHYYYKSKINLGCRRGSNVLTTFDGKFTLFVTDLGLVAMSYQDFVASSEQTLTYLSQTISSTFSEFLLNTVRLYSYKHWILCYSKNKILLYDLRNNSWWPMTFPEDVLLMYNDDELRFICNGRVYNLDKSYENYYDMDYKNVKYDIAWNVTSQKLHFGNLNNVKHISNVTLISSYDMLQDMHMDLTLFNYRKRQSTSDVQSFNFYVDSIRTFVKRLNCFKVNEFQYRLTSEKNEVDEEYETEIAKVPLSLNNISIKYKILGQVR